MPKSLDEKLENDVMAQAGNILAAYKNDGEEPAFNLWQALDIFTSGKRKRLSPKVLDLLLQLEFFMEEHPETEWNDVVNAYYSAKDSLMGN